jgi:mono/diheme cytochrome c family protein
LHEKLVIGLFGAAAACAGRTTAPAFDAGIDLPAGQGRDLLVESCLVCHDLTALPLFAPFYTRDSWHTLVVTMQAHGADVDNAEIEMLADYLVQHFGPEAP